MSNIKELQKAVDEAMMDNIANKDRKELEYHIKALVKSQYIAYFNNDRRVCNSIQSILDLITDEYSCSSESRDKAYYNIPNYINYCRVVSIHTLLHDLMKRNFNLKMPDEVDIEKATGILEEYIDPEMEALIFQGVEYNENIK